MIELCFGDSIKGSLKIAQHCGRGTIASAFSVVFLNESELSKEEKRRETEKIVAAQKERERNAVPLGGNPNDVLAFGFFDLSIGDISDFPENFTARKKLTTEWLCENPHGESDKTKLAESADKYWTAYIKDFEALKNRASNGEHVRIWADYSPHSICGLLCVAYVLSDINADVSVIFLPDTINENNLTVKYRFWGEVEPEYFGKFLHLEKQLTKNDINMLAKHYREIRKENSPLRTVINKKAVSVDENFYDDTILSAVPDSDFKVAQLIGKVLINDKIGISDYFIAQRIKALINSGIFEIVEKAAGFYQYVIRTNNTTA